MFLSKTQEYIGLPGTGHMSRVREMLPEAAKVNPAAMADTYEVPINITTENCAAFLHPQISLLHPLYRFPMCSNLV